MWVCWLPAKAHWWWKWCWCFRDLIESRTVTIDFQRTLWQTAQHRTQCKVSLSWMSNGIRLDGLIFYNVQPSYTNSVVFRKVHVNVCINYGLMICKPYGVWFNCVAILRNSQSKTWFLKGGNTVCIEHSIAHRNGIDVNKNSTWNLCYAP